MQNGNVRGRTVLHFPDPSFLVPHLQQPFVIESTLLLDRSLQQRSNYTVIQCDRERVSSHLTVT